MRKRTRFLSLLLAMVLLFSSVPLTAFAAGDVMHGIAFVNASSLRLRSEANTSSKTLATAARNEVVVVISKQGDWYKVNYNLQEGYMHSDYLKVKTAENAELGYGSFNTNKTNLRSGAGTSFKKITTANKGDKAYIVGIQDGWYKIIYGNNVCYVRSDYLDLTEVPYENKRSSNKPLFFKGGVSTGVTVSANALNGKDGSDDSDASISNTTTNSSSSDSTAVSTASSGVMYGVATTTGSGLRLRSSTSTSSSTLASASKGEGVVVVSKQGEWYKVIYNLKEGYMHGDYLNVKTTENVELGYGIVNANKVNMRSGAGTSNSKVATANKGDKAYIVGISGGWYKVIYGQQVCYIRSDYLNLSEAPYENKASSKSPIFFRGGKSTGVDVSASALNGTSSSSGSSDKNNSSSSSTTTTAPSSTGEKIVSTAKKYLGVPYVWGGSSPSGFDCSGLVYYVLRSCGYSVSRTSSAMYKDGTPVAKSDLQPGDVVFFQNTYKAGISHVGIYVGNGQFIHSPSTGEVVSYDDLYSDYYTSHYYGACRFG